MIEGPLAPLNWTSYQSILSPVPWGGITEIIEVPVLTKDTVWEYALIAQNMLGVSPIGESAAIYIPTVIGKPTIIYASALPAQSAAENTSIQIWWSGDNATLEYLVEWRETGEIAWESNLFSPHHFGLDSATISNLEGFALLKLFFIFQF